MNKDAFREALAAHQAALRPVPDALEHDDLPAWRDALRDLAQTLATLEALWPPAGDALATEGDTGDLT